MPTNFPGSLDTFTTKVPHVSANAAADVNNLQDAVAAIEATLKTTPNPNPLDFVSKTQPDTISGVKRFTQVPLFDAGIGPVADVGGMVYNVKHPRYGAYGDGRVVLDGAITSGLAVFTSATAAFTSADIGKQVCIDGAGTIQGGVRGGYKGVILSLNSGTSANMDTTAGATVSGAEATIGHDDTAAVQLAITDAVAAGGGTIYRPASSGYYLMNSYYTEGASSARYCLKVGSGGVDSNVSNIRLLSEGRAAAVYQGPAGRVPVAASYAVLLLILNSNSSSYDAQTLYHFNAVGRGDVSVTMTTAGDAANWKAGDVIWLRSGSEVDSTSSGEINLVRSVNAGTGVVTLRWPTSRSFAASGTYGAAQVTAFTGRNLALENEWHYAWTYAWSYQNILGLKFLGGHVESIVAPPFSGSMVANDNNLRAVTFRDFDCLCANPSFAQFSECTDLLIEDSKFELMVGVSVGAVFSLTNSCANITIRGNLLRTPGGTSGLWSVISLGGPTWGCVIEDNTVYMNTVTSPGSGVTAAITEGTNSTAHELEIRYNWISGPTSGLAILVASDGAVVEGNRIRVNGWGIIARATTTTARIWILGNKFTAINTSNYMIYVGGNAANHNHVIAGNLGLVEAGAPAGTFINIPNDGAVTKSAMVVGNYASGFATGLAVASVANEGGLYVAGNDLSGCTTPYSPTNPMGGIVAITVTASPFTYTAGTTSPEEVYIDGGTVTTVVKNGITLYSFGAAAARARVHLSPAEAVVVTYTVAPTMNKDRVA